MGHGDAEPDAGAHHDAWEVRREETGMDETEAALDAAIENLQTPGHWTRLCRLLARLLGKS